MFDEIKKQYTKLREEEQKKIIAYLEDNGYSILNKGKGHGAENYNAHRHLEVPYDLSNWKWIDIKKNNQKWLISLQAFDVDSNTKNHHVLMDRIGIYKYEEYNAEEAFNNMVVTEIDLPMDEEKMEQLLKML